MKKNTLIKLLNQAAIALSYIHNSGYLHNDVKGNNILLDATQSGDVQAYLNDFGKACLQTNGKGYYLSAEECIQHNVNHPHISPGHRTYSHWEGDQKSMQDEYSNSIYYN